MSLFGNLYNEQLPTRAKIVYMNLKDRADKNGVCFPSHKKIAADTSLSVSSVKRGLDDLIASGYIVKQHRKRKYDNGYTSNFYKLMK